MALGERRLLDIAINTRSIGKSGSESMDISELTGEDTNASKRAANRRMVQERECRDAKEIGKVGRKPKWA